VRIRESSADPDGMRATFLGLETPKFTLRLPTFDPHGALASDQHCPMIVHRGVLVPRPVPFSEKHWDNVTPVRTQNRVR
jgi:hypothetical protein